MDRKLANVYMTALTEAAARMNKLSPVTEAMASYVALGSLTMPRLANALLSDTVYAPTVIDKEGKSKRSSQ